jgi:hypothetical protein
MTGRFRDATLRSRRGAVVGSGLTALVPLMIIMIVILLGVSAAMYSYFGRGIDTRQQQAYDLYGLIRECAVAGTKIITGDQLSLTACGIDEEIFNHGAYFVALTPVTGGVSVTAGVSDFLVRCGLDARFKNHDYPLCHSGIVVINGVRYTLQVGAAQQVKRVAVA